MSKKSLAAVTALIICLGLAGCGDTEENAAPSAGTTSVTTAERPEETSSAADSAEDKTADKAADADTAANAEKSGSDTADMKDTEVVSGDGSENDTEAKPEKKYAVTDDTIEAEGLVLKLNSENTLTMFEKDIEAEPTAEELSAVIEAALSQYRAAEDKDLDAFIASFRFEDLADPTAALLMDMSKHPEDEDFLAFLRESGQGTKYEIIDDMVSLIDSMIDDKHREEFEKIMAEPGAAGYEDTRNILHRAFSDITMSSKNVTDNIEYDTVFDTSEEGVKPLEGVDGSTVYALEIEHCAREENAIYMNFDLMILTAGKEYTLSDVAAWNTGNGFGVYLDDRLHISDIEEELKGKNAREIFEMLKETAAE